MLVDRKRLLKFGVATWPSGLTTMMLLPLLAFCAAFVSCKNEYTKDPQSDVVKLRNDLRDFAAGNLQEVRGHTLQNDTYVLLYGYQGPLDSLPIPETLQRELKALTPYDYERYVLVHIVGDEIKEYTQWEPGDDPLFWPLPLMIRGDPFKITAEQRERYKVTIRLE
jgi:hypothetical protein